MPDLRTLRRLVLVDREEGEISRHWTYAAAERAALEANAWRDTLQVRYRVVRRGRRWLVVSFQNLRVRA